MFGALRHKLHEAVGFLTEETCQVCGTHPRSLAPLCYCEIPGCGAAAVELSASGRRCAEHRDPGVAA